MNMKFSSQLQTQEDAKKSYESFILQNDKEIEIDMIILGLYIKEINALNLSKDQTEELINFMKKNMEDGIPVINELTEQYKSQIKIIEERIEKIKNYYQKYSSIDLNQQDEENKQNSQENLDESEQDPKFIETSNSSGEENHEASKQQTVLSENQILSSQNNDKLTVQETKEEKKNIQDFKQEVKDDKKETKKDFYQQLQDQKKEMQTFFDEQQELNIKQQSFYDKLELQNYEIQTKLDLLSAEIKQFQKIENEKESSSQNFQLAIIIFNQIAQDYGYEDFYEFYDDSRQFEKKEKIKFNEALIQKAKEKGLTKEEWDIFVRRKKDVIFISSHKDYQYY